MKKLTIIISFAVILLTACSEDSSNMEMQPANNMETAVEHAGKHLDANYVCPMHPQIIRGKEGSCPICG